MEQPAEVERRHAAILAADAQGYSRLMGEDEIGTVRTLTAHRAAMREAIARFRGRVVDSPGDNLLAEFPSAFDAVECAAAIQSTLRQRNAALPEGRRLAFRIGVNAGPVIVEGERIYGDAVNVAARLEALADAGGVCISGEVHDQVAGALGLQWESLGERAVKNILRPVRVYRARLPGGPEARASPTPPARVYRPSIAVLPFRESGAPEAERYFAEGIVEDVIGALASLPDLFVISGTSTARFRDRPADVKAVGQELAVRYVLSGSIRRAGDRIRISSELADTDTQVVVWTDRLESRVDDLFELQDRLSERTIATIAPHVQEAEIRRALRKRPESMDAYDYMLRGLDLLYRLERREFEQAREMFERALALDPAYATPYALSALWHSIRIGQGWSVDEGADYGEAARLAEAALARDPLDARALALSGHVRAFLLHDYEGAFALFDRALATSPNSAVAWIRSSPAYSYVGDAAEARRRAEIGLRLSPFDPHLFYTHTALGFACYTGGQWDQAVAWCRRAMSASPHFTANLRFLAASLVAAGRAGEAREIGRALLALAPGFRVRPFCESYAYKDPERRAALADHLLAAGLPE
jgi:TolB-like protein/Tfp pilus assembly protein PilF